MAVAIVLFYSARELTGVLFCPPLSMAAIFIKRMIITSLIFTALLVIWFGTYYSKSAMNDVIMTGRTFSTVSYNKYRCLWDVSKLVWQSVGSASPTIKLSGHFCNALDIMNRLQAYCCLPRNNEDFRSTFWPKKMETMAQMPRLRAWRQVFLVGGAGLQARVRTKQRNTRSQGRGSTEVGGGRASC